MEGDLIDAELALINAISIHSLRMEGDMTARMEVENSTIFQSTPSAWRETVLDIFAIGNISISIHSLRMEGDERQQVYPPSKDISIHSLRMEGDRQT